MPADATFLSRIAPAYPTPRIRIHTMGDAT